MNPREEGFLLLSSTLGNPWRKPLTTAQLRTLTLRMAGMKHPGEERELSEKDLTAMGYSRESATHILKLLDDEQLMRYYLNRGKREGCVPLTRISAGYPQSLRQKLGNDCPGVLWGKGDFRLLERKAVALVGSRELREENRNFAAEAGYQAAKQGYVLISGNARGADRTAQDACLAAGGQVISVVADALTDHPIRENVLYLSEDGFDMPFTAQRALSRNRLIHAMGEKTMVCQCSLETGGTWSGTVHNLRGRWSPVFCFWDGSEAMLRLEMMGAQLIEAEQLKDLRALTAWETGLF